LLYRPEPLSYLSNSAVASHWPFYDTMASYTNRTRMSDPGRWASPLAFQSSVVTHVFDGRPSGSAPVLLRRLLGAEVMECAAEDTSVALQIGGWEPGDAQCGTKLVTSTHPPNTHHRMGLALRCMHQRADTLAAPDASPPLPLCPALAATFPSP